MAYNAYWSNVGLALRFTGSNGSTAITCDKGRSITLHGSDIAISTAWYDVSPSSGYYSAATQATAGSALEVGYHADYADWGNGAGTIAFTFRTPAELSGYTVDLFQLSSPSGADGRVTLYLYNGRLFYSGGPWWDDNYYEGDTLSPNTVYRVMLARNGSSTWKLMVNGAVVLTHVQYEPYAIGGSDYQAWLFGSPVFELGVLDHVNSAVNPIQMDEVFVVKGVALEFGSYTPAPMFEDYAGGDPPEDITCDFAGAIELSGELLASQPFLADFAGTLELTGDFQASQPFVVVMSGTIELSGDFQASQPAFAVVTGALSLSGTLSTATGPAATLGGPLGFSGGLLAGVGPAANFSGVLPLTGGVVARHGRSAAFAATLELVGAMSAEHREAFIAAMAGTLPLAGELRGDYQLYPPQDASDVVFVRHTEQRVYIHG